MPNGGSDNCLTCGFNETNSGEWDTHAHAHSAKHFCTIRKIAIADPAYTYCKNRGTRADNPAGPLFRPGLVHIYTRIPWYGNQIPETHVEGKCIVCGEIFKTGIRIKMEDSKEAGFCNDKEYVEWWQKRFPGEALYFQYDWDKINEDFRMLEKKNAEDLNRVPMNHGLSRQLDLDLELKPPKDGDLDM